MIGQVRRLPVDVVTLARAKAHAKHQFQVSAVLARTLGRYRDYSRVMAQILDGDYSQLKQVLDIVYKHRGRAVYKHHYNTINTFVGRNYDQLRHSYPQLHLFTQLNVPPRYLQRYNDSLSVANNLIIVDTGGLNKIQSDPIALIHSQPKVDDTNLNQIQRFYSFLRSQGPGRKILGPIDVVYPPNRFGKALNIVQRDKILHNRINDVKKVVSAYKPISKHDLTTLNAVATGEIPLNPQFWSHLRKNHKLLPFPKKIIKLYKMYLVDQFYIEDGVYHMNWLNKFYP